MTDLKLLRESQTIRQIITKQSAVRLDSLHSLHTFCLSTHHHFNTFSTNLRKSHSTLIHHKTIPSLHHHLHTVCSIMETQVDLMIDITEEIGRELKEITEGLQDEIQEIENKNQKIWRELTQYQKEVREYCEDSRFEKEKNQSVDPFEKNRITGIGQEYKKILKDFSRINDDIPNFVKTNLIKVIKELNKILGEPTLKRVLDDIEREHIKPIYTIDKLVADSIVQKFGDTEFLKDQRSNTGKVTKHYQQLNKFTDYFLNRSASNVQEYMSIRAIILEDDIQGDYFLGLLYHKIKGQLSLTIQKYQDLLSIVKYIFGNLIQSKDSEHINKVVSILNMATRISCRNQYLSKDLNRYHQYWNSEKLWFKIHKVVSHRSEKKKPINIKKFINKIPFDRLQGLKGAAVAQISRIEKWFGYNSDEIEQERQYQIMKQINIYLTKLQLNSEFTLNILKTLADKYGMSKENLEKLIKFQYTYRRKQLDQSFLSPKFVKSRKEQEYESYGLHPLTFAVGKSLKYLELNSKLVEMRLVSKEWREHLTEDIYARYLKDEENMDLLSKYRLPLYRILSNGQGFTGDIYQKMIESVPMDLPDRDIIGLDVKRSLSWNPSLRDKLTNILVTFSFYHRETGYLQGMNYLAQHLLRLTTGPQCYKMFQHIMVNQYSLVFNDSFDLLKLKLYQLMRLLQFHLPRLFNHFLSQGIEGEHFLIAWAITLWGEYQGEITWVVSDGFMIDGWKWWMQICLWVFERQQNLLLGLDFEGIMKYFSEMNHNGLFTGKVKDISGGKMKEEIQRFDVTDKMLDEIKKEYFISIKKLKEMSK